MNQAENDDGTELTWFAEGNPSPTRLDPGAARTPHRVSFAVISHWEWGRRRLIPIALDRLKTLAAQAKTDLANFTDGEEGNR